MILQFYLDSAKHEILDNSARTSPNDSYFLTRAAAAFSRATRNIHDRDVDHYAYDRDGRDRPYPDRRFANGYLAALFVAAIALLFFLLPLHLFFLLIFLNHFRPLYFILGLALYFAFRFFY
jgi:hypothetical protein